VSGNTAYNNSVNGFKSYSSSNNFSNNVAYNNYYHGFYFDTCSNNNLFNNTAYNSTSYSGFYLYYGSANALTNNTAYNNAQYGIYVYYSPDNNLSNNTAYSNAQYGFYVYSSDNNNLSTNTAYNNAYYGFYLQYSSASTLTNNTAYNNQYGINLADVTSSNITANNITENTDMGISANSNSGNNQLSSNLICSNGNLDINNANSSNNGSSNTCDAYSGWSENGHLGCTFACTLLWHRIFGNTSGDIFLTANASGNTSYVYKWAGASGLNVYFVDYDSDIQWGSLIAIGRNTTGNTSTNDFIELDNAFNSSNYSDNITVTYSSDGSTPLETFNYTVYGTAVNYAPVANSTVQNTIFKTGIMWDSSDGGTEYSNTYNQSTVWVVRVNASAPSDAYGNYNYLIRVPYTLGSYEGTNDIVDIYLELQ